MGFSPGQELTDPVEEMLAFAKEGEHVAACEHLNL